VLQRDQRPSQRLQLSLYCSAAQPGGRQTMATGTINPSGSRSSVIADAGSKGVREP